MDAFQGKQCLPDCGNPGKLQGGSRKKAASKERQNWKRGKGRLGRQDNPDMTRLPREHTPPVCGGQVRRPPGWEEACLPGGELKKISLPLESGGSLRRSGTGLEEIAKGTQRGSYADELCACDMMKAVFLENESSMDVPDGDIPNFLKFPKVFSLFRGPVSLFRVIKMPHCPMPARGTPAVMP